MRFVKFVTPLRQMATSAVFCETLNNRVVSVMTGPVRLARRLACRS